MQNVSSRVGSNMGPTSEALESGLRGKILESAWNRGLDRSRAGEPKPNANLIKPDRETQSKQ
jgi:hypothetical protein